MYFLLQLGKLMVELGNNALLNLWDCTAGVDNRDIEIPCDGRVARGDALLKVLRFGFECVVHIMEAAFLDTLGALGLIVER